MRETDWRDAFVDYAKSSAAPKYLVDSLWCKELPLKYDQSSTRTPRDLTMPDYFADAVEVDRQGNLHLWEAKKLEDRDLISGKVLGQIIFYDWMFRTAESSHILAELSKKGLPGSQVDKLLNSTSLRFATWNILVCGGRGWELCAGVNPMAWTYFTLQEDYLKPEFQVNIFHFTSFRDRFILKNICELSVLVPARMDEEVFDDYLNEHGKDKREWMKFVECLAQKNRARGDDPTQMESDEFAESTIKRQSG